METDPVLPQQATQVPETKRKNGVILWVLILALLVTNVITGIFLILSFKNENRKIGDVSTSDKSDDKRPNYMYTGLTDEIKNTYQLIVEGEINYQEEKESVETFNENYDLTNEGNGYLEFKITVYKYFPGASFSDGYEGITYTTNLDTIKNRLLGLRLGKQVGSVLMNEPLMPGNYEIIYKKLGSRNYAVYDTTFLGGGVFRHYVSFDTGTNQLIHLVVSMTDTESAPEGWQECYDYERNICVITYDFPKELREVISDIENLLSRN